MTDTPPTTLRQAREATIDALCQAFAGEELSLGELERRLEAARSARTRRELNELLAGVSANVPMKTAARPAAGSEKAPATRPRTEAPDRRPADGRGGHLAIAVMGGTRRAGRWEPPAEMAAVAIMGGVELDFTAAVMEGTTEINCFALWGAVEITVPPHVRVESQGFALLGGFDEHAELKARSTADGPTVRVNGFALMGAVEIKVAEPGGS